MSVLEWDASGEHFYETGIDRGVLYVMTDGSYGDGEAWNGLTGITESPSGAEDTNLYADNIKYLILKSAEEFGATIEAYTYPAGWKLCNGSLSLSEGVEIGQQPRSVFGLSYRTKIGNDTNLDNHGYKIHLIYGAQTKPSESSYQTVNDSPEAVTFSWEISTTPINVPGYKPTSTLVIDSTKVDADKLKSFEDIIYGTAQKAARLPLPSEVMSHFAQG